MNIEDLLSDLQSNNTTVNGRTTLNNISTTSTATGKEHGESTNQQLGSSSTGVNTYLNSETDQSFLGANVSHISEVGGESVPFLTKQEKNQRDIAAYIALTTSWRNERMSPELLPFNHAAFDKVSQNMKRQIEYIDYWNMMQESEAPLPSADRKANEDLLIQKKINKLPLYCMEAELERVKFLLRSYLRCRLQKIDSFLMLLEENDQLVVQEDTLEEKSILITNKLLSETEYRYFKQKAKIVLKLYSSTVLLNLPENFQQLNDENSNVKMIHEPDLERFVFIFIKGSAEKQNTNLSYKVFNRETREEVVLVVGGIYVMRYDLIESFVKEGIAMLI